jgi:uncharacterized FAD-dependent dehydrogenase
LYDVVIVGAGPAGIFAGFRFKGAIEAGADLSVLILDAGPQVDRRRCVARELGRTCVRCPSCHLHSGWGGAGAFSDGKITLSPDIGGWMSKVVGQEGLSALLDRVDKVFLEFGAPAELYGTDEEKFEAWSCRAALADLRLEKNILRHMGTDLSMEVMRRMYGSIREAVEVKLNTEVATIKKENGHVVGVTTEDSKFIQAKNVLVAPGRRGASWLAEQCSTLDIPVSSNPVDLGVRVELPADVVGPLTDDLYEPKLRFMSKSFDDPVRTFCVNPRGQVITEYYDDVVTVNGHSMKDGKTANTNFALLVNNYFTEPFKDPISYGKYISRLANLISNGIVVQRLWDLLHGRRSTPERLSQSVTVPTLRDATPGDLSFILPHRIMTDIIEMLRALDKLAPGVISMNTLLYGVEAKFYSSRVGTDASLQTPVRGLYVAGDGAGLTRGLSQSAASGLHAAEAILSSRKVAKPA